MIRSFWEKHQWFISSVYSVTGVIAAIAAIVTSVADLFTYASTNNLAGILLYFLFFTLIVSFKTVIGTLVWGTIAVAALFLPYLAIRGLVR